MEAVEDADPGSDARVGWLNRLVGELAGRVPGPRAQRRLERDADVALRARARHGGHGPQQGPGGRCRAQCGPPGVAPPLTRHRLGGRRLRARHGSTLCACRRASTCCPVSSSRTRSTSYPTSDLGQALAAVSRVLKSDTGTSLVTVDQGDWDHHTGVGTITYGRMLNNTSDLAASIAAFFADLGPLADKVTLVTMSEFGRRVVENAQRGLDHGWGNVMFLAGAGVKGGRYYGTWPGLGPVTRRRSRSHDRLPQCPRRGGGRPHRSLDRHGVPGAQARACRSHARPVAQRARPGGWALCAQARSRESSSLV